MVTAYPLPEGFTELEVFAIGSALLVEGKLGVGPQHQQGFCPLFLVGGGKEIEAKQQHLWHADRAAVVTAAASPVLLVSDPVKICSLYIAAPWQGSTS